MRSVQTLAAVLVATLVSGVASAASASDLAVVGAKVYPAPDAPAITNAVLLVHDGRIQVIGPRGAVTIPAGAAILDETGKVITAGFWNNHVHLLTPILIDEKNQTDAALTLELDRMFTRWGFTTVFDLASTTATASDLRRRVEAGVVAGPNILTVGEPFYPPHGTPSYAKPIYEQYHLPSAEIQSIPEAVARVDRQVAQGVNGIKLFTGAVEGASGVLPMPLDDARAISAEAHRLGRPVFAHPSNQAGLDVAVDGGVDILAHVAPLSGPWTPAFIDRLKARHMALIPTLMLFQVYPSSETPMEVALQQLKAQADSGGDILFGTDAGFMDVYDPTAEYSLMGRVLDWRAILASLTSTPARRFGQADRRGRLAPGMIADFVVLNGDPAEDVTNFAKVRAVFRGGKVISGAP